MFLHGGSTIKTETKHVNGTHDNIVFEPKSEYKCEYFMSCDDMQMLIDRISLEISYHKTEKEKKNIVINFINEQKGKQYKNYMECHVYEIKKNKLTETSVFNVGKVTIPVGKKQIILELFNRSGTKNIELKNICVSKDVKYDDKNKKVIADDCPDLKIKSTELLQTEKEAKEAKEARESKESMEESEWAAESQYELQQKQKSHVQQPHEEYEGEYDGYDGHDGHDGHILKKYKFC